MTLAACGRSLQLPLMSSLLPDISPENKVPAIIITLTDGTLLRYAFEETKKQVSAVYCYQYFAPYIW